MIEKKTPFIKSESSSLGEIAVLIPCFNEAEAIPRVVDAFRRHLPSATVYVYDNNSTDGTAEIAAAHGAVVRNELRQGKGHVVRRMFADIEASIYLLVDGDDTYDAEAAPAMLRELLDTRSDMVNGARQTSQKAAYRFGHRFGNHLLTGMVAWIFGKRFNDILSGYRVFSRRFVKSFPALSTGFEIETELTIHALSLDMPTTEIETYYKDRPMGTSSKLNTYRDGFRILSTIIRLTKEERPVAVFTAIFVLFAALSIALGAPVVSDFLDTGKVLRLPTALLAVSLMILAFLSVSTGQILSSVTRARTESRRLNYLSQPWLGVPGRATERVSLKEHGRG